MFSRHFSFAALLIAIAVIPAHAQNQTSTARSGKITGVAYDFISMNNVLMWLSNNGGMSHNPVTDAAGLEWPKGSGKTLIFEDGIVWGGLVGGSLRVGGSTSRHGIQPGPLDANGNPVRPVTDPRNRIFKVRKTSSTEHDAMSEMDKERLKRDYTEWPVGDGAPYTNRDGIAGYQPDFNAWLTGSPDVDEPLMIGDEVLWYVANDQDPALTSYLYGSPPIGIELQTLVWAYADTGPLGNIIFTRYRLTNKGTEDMTDAFISKWSDPDLGYANDDFVGVDTLLNLGFAYNGRIKDGTYGIPPAIGYAFLQGPHVPSPGDTAWYDLRSIPDYRNLPLTSFVPYICGSSAYNCPSLGTSGGGVEIYNNQQGLMCNGSEFIDPTTGRPIKHAFSGDPISGTGWIDGVPSGPGDRVFLMSSGPFTLKKNESREIIIATIVGLGTDNRNSLHVMKRNCRTAQSMYNRIFQHPELPRPCLEYAVSDGRIELSWGHPDCVRATEEWRMHGYRFEGYNLYQLRSASSPPEEEGRIATYDVVDNVTTIWDDVYDDRVGTVVSLPVAFGNDEGIRRTHTATRDHFSGRFLVNNQPYYFALTAYGYHPDPDVRPRVVETAPSIIEVRPQFPNPGYRNLHLIRDSLVTVKRVSGTSIGRPVVQVLDPLALNGHAYEVTFSKLGERVVMPFDHDGDTTTPRIDVVLDNYGWNLRDATTGRMLADTIRFYDGLNNILTVDGFKIGMTGIPYWRPYREIASTEWSGGPVVFDSHLDWMLGSNFFGSRYSNHEVVKSVEVRFDRNRKSKGYMYLRGGSPNYGYRGYYDSPITVWDVSEEGRERQICYAFVEQAGSPYQNNSWGPGWSAGDREYLFIIDEPYSETPNPAYTGSFRIYDHAGTMPILFAGWWEQSIRQSDPTDYRWRDGDFWRITANAPFTTADRFEFETIKWEYSNEVAKKDVEAVNVFPNPYFGDNVQELNRYQRFVTFNHLPPEAVIRIYTLSGTLVRTLQKHDESQIAAWDLLNEGGYPVGSGIYIIHIDMPGLGTQKVLKLSVIMEAQYLDRI